MSFYDRHVLPWIICTSCATKPVMKQREKIVPLATGRILEVGAGGGLNMPFYDASKVEAVLGLDNSAELMRSAELAAQKTGIPFTPLVRDAASIPLEAKAVDTVVVTYTLCSIAQVQVALAEIRRVLKPSGHLLFCEHGAAPDPAVHLWQQRLTPLWKKFAGGCHLDRDLPHEISLAGYRFEKLEHMYLPGTARIVGYNSWGIAVPD